MQEALTERVWSVCSAKTSNGSLDFFTFFRQLTSNLSTFVLVRHSEIEHHDRIRHDGGHPFR